jgi:hypothetical protein
MVGIAPTPSFFHILSWREVIGSLFVCDDNVSLSLWKVDIYFLSAPYFYVKKMSLFMKSNFIYLFIYFIGSLFLCEENVSLCEKQMIFYSLHLWPKHLQVSEVVNSSCIKMKHVIL